MTNALRLYRAIVTATDDPQGLGRVQLSITRTVRKSPVQVEGWANVAASSPGTSADLRPLYTVGDNVLYAAERLPFVGAVVLCREMNAGANERGYALALFAGSGNEMKIEASDSAVHLSTAAGQKVTVHANGSIELLANEISLKASKLTVAAAFVTVDSGMVQFSGVVKCDTLISNSVIAASYTPGAGNVW